MNCPKCRKEILDDTIYCNYCGAKTRFKQQNYEQLYEEQEDMFIMGISIPNTFWVLGLRIVSLLAIVVVVALGIYQWAKLADYDQGGFGFLVFLICTIIAFIVVATLMVFLDMARDVRRVRKYIEKK